MNGFSLENFDKHIDNLRAQLRYLSHGLNATDHNTPEWLTTDLITLRNRSGRLHDDMKRFRDRLSAEDPSETEKIKGSSKRLSIEGVEQSDPNKRPRTASQGGSNIVPPETAQTPTPRAKPARSESTYIVQNIDITDEVNRRLQESRLRRLMETPSTAQKRKFDAFEDIVTSNEARSEESGTDRSLHSGSECDGTPSKRLRVVGMFEHTLKRKETVDAAGFGEESPPSIFNRKRRRC